MARLRGSWINLVALIVGCGFLGAGILGLTIGFSFRSTFTAAFGFLIAGWAVLDYRRFLRNTAESEVDGGHTIE